MLSPGTRPIPSSRKQRTKTVTKAHSLDRPIGGRPRHGPNTIGVHQVSVDGRYDAKDITSMVTGKVRAVRTARAQPK
jgi:hypothetical protein